MELKNLIETHLDLPRLAKDPRRAGDARPHLGRASVDASNAGQALGGREGLPPRHARRLRPARRSAPRRGHPPRDEHAARAQPLPEALREAGRPRDEGPAHRLQLPDPLGLHGARLLRRPSGERRGRGGRRLHDGPEGEARLLAAHRRQLQAARPLRLLRDDRRHARHLDARLDRPRAKEDRVDGRLVRPRAGGPEARPAQSAS